MDTLLGALKALVAGISAGGAALLVYLGVPEQLVAIVFVIVGPVLVYLVPNLGTQGEQESAEIVAIPDAAG